MNCPTCGSDNITASHRRGLEKMIKYIVPMAPFRCKGCWGRFWKFKNPLKSTASKVTAGIVFCILVVVLTLLALRQGEVTSVRPMPDGRFDDDAFARLEHGNRGTESREAELPKKETEENSKLEGLTEDNKPLERLPEKEEPSNTEEVTEKQDTLSVEVEKPTPVLAEVPKPHQKTEAPRKERSASPPVLKEVTKQPEKIKQPQPVEKNVSGVKSAPSPDKPKTKKTSAKKPETRVQSPQKRILKGIWHKEEDPDKFSMAVISGQPIKKFRHFFIESPPRLVINIPGKWENPGEATKIVGGKVVKRVRIGEHKDKLSIVLDLAGKGPFIPSIKESSNGLNVVLVKKPVEGS